IRRLVQQIDAHLVIGDADVHMHAADREAPTDALQVAREALVADALSRPLGPPSREGMSSGGDRRQIVSPRHRSYRTAQSAQVGPRFVEAGADPRPDLN